MRVLTVGNLYPPHDQGGGYEAVWHGAVEALRARGHDVRVLATDHREPGSGPDGHDVHRELRWFWEDGGFPRRPLRADLATERHNLAVLRRHLREFSPDVVGWWSMGGMSLSLLDAARRAGVPAVAFVHDDWLDYGPRADGWQRRFAGRPRTARAAQRATGIPTGPIHPDAAHFAFVSRATRDHAWMLGAATPHRSVVPSGIDARFIDPAPAREWDWSLLYVGRIDARKGVRTAAGALQHLPSGANLTIAGDGPDALSLEDREGVRLLGRRTPEAVQALYARTDAVVFPVEWSEPWGLVPLEAMARGRPVVATGRGGSAEYLRDGVNALLFPAGDARALADRLRRLAEDTALRARLVAGGIETARRHTAEAFNDAVEQLLAARLERPAPAPVPAPAGEPDVVFQFTPSPEIEAAHRAAHRRHPGAEHAVQGAVDAPREPFARWLARRGHPPLPAPHAGVIGAAYLDSRNLSVKRELLQRAGGGPEPGCLGDLAFAQRLSEHGLRLHYEPGARMAVPAPSLAAVRAALPAAAAAHPELADRVAHAAALGPARGRLRALIPYIGESVPWLGPRVWRSATTYYERELSDGA